MTDRREQLGRNLAEVRARIGAAAVAAGRSPDDVTLIVITKTWPMSDVDLLAELGVRDIGENRDQEAAPKAAAAQQEGLGLTWHFVGQVQRNKAAHIARYADYVHAVDRVRLVPALDRGAGNAGRGLRVFVQVDLAGGADLGRAGAAADEVAGICAALEQAESLELVGLMAVAPLDADPVAAFERLAQVRAGVMKGFPAARLLSAGMSGDFEAAIAAGATHVRVGSAVLGVRHNVR